MHLHRPLVITLPCHRYDPPEFVVEYSGQSAFDLSQGLWPFSGPSPGSYPSIILSHVSVYDLRSFSVVLMFMDGDLLSLLLLVLVLLIFLLLLSEVGLVG